MILVLVFGLQSSTGDGGGARRSEGNRGSYDHLSNQSRREYRSDRDRARGYGAKGLR